MTSTQGSWPRTRWGEARPWLLGAVLFAATLWFGTTVHAGQPVHRWLVWRYLTSWGLASLWAVACFSAGHAALRRVVRTPTPLVEHVTMSLATGVLCFFLAMFVGGLAHLYGRVFFVALPCAMIAAGGRDTLRYVARVVRHVRASGVRLRVTPVSAVVALAGLAALLVFYVASLSPANVGYDSRWYHLPLAEHYVARHGIERLAEGWQPGAIGHLPSIVYTWAFMMPGSSLFDRLELAAHLEFVCFLIALLGVPALVRRLVPGARAWASWAAVFTFPSLYWYAGLVGGDEIAMIWAAPITLALLRAWPGRDVRRGAVLGAMLAGLFLTKYSAAGLLGAVVAVVAVGSVFVMAKTALRQGPRAALFAGGGGVAAGVAMIVLSTPLWLKNWVWYGDPLFPLLSSHMHPRPWTPDVARFAHAYDVQTRVWYPTRDWAGVKETLLALPGHALQSADFATGGPQPAPYRGALFVLLGVALPFCGASRRLWGVTGLTYLAIGGWYWLFHQDRYLMALMPMMAAVVASISLLVWRDRAWSKATLVGLVGLHSAWGLGIFGLSAPAEHIRAVLDLASAAPERGASAGLDHFRGWMEVRRRVPRDGKVLVHQHQMHLGIGRATVSDWPMLQTGISYGRLGSPGEVYDLLRAMGVTHVAWNDDNWANDTMAGDLRFLELAKLYTNPQPVGWVYLGELPATRPPAAIDGREDEVLFLGCSEGYRAGVYKISDMMVVDPFHQLSPVMPEPVVPLVQGAQLVEPLSRARFVAHDPGCGFRLPDGFPGPLVPIGRRKQLELFARPRR